MQHMTFARTEVMFNGGSEAPHSRVSSRAATTAKDDTSVRGKRARAGSVLLVAKLDAVLQAAHHLGDQRAAVFRHPVALAERDERSPHDVVDGQDLSDRRDEHVAD